MKFVGDSLNVNTETAAAYVRHALVACEFDKHLLPNHRFHRIDTVNDIVELITEKAVSISQSVPTEYAPDIRMASSMPL